MFQNLLADRFNLSSTKKPESEQDYNIPITLRQNNVFIGTRVSMQYFSWTAAPARSRPAIDKTGLDKNYDFTLVFATH